MLHLVVGKQYLITTEIAQILDMQACLWLKLGYDSIKKCVFYINKQLSGLQQYMHGPAVRQ